MTSRAIVTVAALLLGACDRTQSAASTASSAIVLAPAIATSTPPVLVNTVTSATPIATATAIADPDEHILRAADVVSMVPVRGPLRRGTFEARLAAPEGPRALTIAIALIADPNAYKRPLAFEKLARAMGARAVPKATLRHMQGGELSAIAGDAGDATAIVREARVLNDGTVDVLVAARSTAHAGSAWEAPLGRVIDPMSAPEMATWERWAASTDPAPGENTSVLRDYVEMIALDYLSANDARRHAIVTDRAILLTDNTSAFPPHPEKAMVDRALRRLRGAERFPRGLRDALAAFDKDRSEATFARGGFTTWMLTPRARVELDERRAALLSLIEAKVAARGEGAVLCL